MLVNIWGSNRNLLRFTPVGRKRRKKLQKKAAGCHCSLLSFFSSHPSDLSCKIGAGGIANKKWWENVSRWSEYTWKLIMHVHAFSNCCRILFVHQTVYHILSSLVEPAHTSWKTRQSFQKLELSAHHIRRHSQHPWEVFHKRLHFHRRPQHRAVLGEVTQKVEGLWFRVSRFISEDIQRVPSFKFHVQSLVGESHLPGYHQLTHPSHPNQPNPHTKGIQTHTTLGTGLPMLCRVLDI